MNHLISTIFFLCSSVLFAQTTDDFTDGDFTSNPIWSGNTSNFTINSSKQLQSNDTVARTSYVSSPHNLTTLDAKEWRCWVKLTFSPSSSNYARVYLSAGSTNLAANPDGFYLQFGESGTKDPVRLYKRDNSTTTLICSGIPGQIAKSFAVGVKVLRDISGNWKLYVDPTGGENFVTYSTGNDPTVILGTSFGVVCKYSASNSKKFYFDNFNVGDEIVDNTPPILHSISVISPKQIDVYFDQEVDTISSQVILNYAIDSTISINSVLLDSINSALVHINLDVALQNGQTYSLTTNSIADNSRNISSIQTRNFTYLKAEIPIIGDVIISEFMADPTPSVGLPEVEYIELYNRSAKYFDLELWKIGDASGDGTISQKWLYPGQYLILCSPYSLTEFPNGSGATSFPSLNNTGDDIVLKYSDGTIIDKISYTDNWYADAFKKQGGYSLERINISLQSSTESNWKTSTALIGGTPGEINSLEIPSNDTTNNLAYLETPLEGDLSINEILYNPLTGGSDFIEIFNSSTKLINLKGVVIANIEKGIIDNKKTITANINLKSGDYLVLTADSIHIKQHYSASVSGKFTQLTLPNYNIDSGSVCVLFKEKIIDKVSYKNEWQLKLIDDSKGKSLERISVNGKSSDASNWHTAAESIGFATPGKINSQDYIYQISGDFEYASKTLSPDNDGFEDVLLIQYRMKSLGMIGNFSIYDATGRIVRTLIKNELLATEGIITWDGTTDLQLKAKIGTYVGVFDAFDAEQGTVFSKTKAFVVAGRIGN